MKRYDQKEGNGKINMVMFAHFSGYTVILHPEYFIMKVRFV